VVINTLYSDPAYADDREQWTQVMEEWDFLSSMLKCQEIEKIENLNFEIALTLPVRLRTLMLNIIDLVGDPTLMQSFYFHSLLVGHIGQQFYDRLVQYGIPLGLLNISNVENRHRHFGRPSYFQVQPEVNAFVSKKRRREEGKHEPLMESREAAWSYYALASLSMVSWFNLERRAKQLEVLLNT